MSTLIQNVTIGSTVTVTGQGGRQWVLYDRSGTWNYLGDPTHAHSGTWWDVNISYSAGTLVEIVTAAPSAYPKTITRGPYSFTANNAEQEAALNDFLGISPAGVELDTYISTLTTLGLANWANYWRGIWASFGRPDIVTFVNGKQAAPTPTPPPTRSILNDIWDYFTKTVPEYYAAQPEALLIPIGAALQGLEALGPIFSGATSTTSEAGKSLLASKAVPALAKAVVSTTWRDAVIASIKANPLMTIFIATEIPNLIQMTQFARNQIAQETGQTLPMIQAQLTALENTIKNAGFDFDAAMKAYKTEDARAILNSIKAALAQYRIAIDTNKTWLTNAGTLANTNAIYDLYATTTAALEAQLPAAGAEIEKQIQETMDVQITKIVDADTVQASTQAIPALTLDVRILGLNAPDKDLTNYWVKSLIDGVEKRYELKIADYKAANAYAVTTLQRAYVTLQIDPANKMDKYGRVLASIKYSVGSGNYALDMVRKGLAVAYLVDTNKYVDIAAFKAAQAAAENERIGLWKTVIEAQAKTETWTLALTSSPSNAKIYVDGLYTRHLTPETMKMTRGMHTIRVERKGYTTIEKNIEAIAGEKIEERFELEKTEAALAETSTGAPAVPGAPTAAAFTISIDSEPSNAKLYIDNIYTHHLTPSNEKELKDVLRLLTPGQHKISANKSGWYGETTVEIVAGANNPIVLTLI